MNAISTQRRPETISDFALRRALASGDWERAARLMQQQRRYPSRWALREALVATWIKQERAAHR